MKSKKDLLLKIAKQLYADLLRQKIKIPENILNEVLSFYNDYQNNDGKEGQYEQIINGCYGKKYIIRQINKKLYYWYKYQQIKRYFSDNLKIIFSDNCPFYSQISPDYSTILINVNYTNQDINNIRHQLLHYFQQMIISDKDFNNFSKQLKEDIKDFQKTSEYTQYIENSCFYIFELYMKIYNKSISFEQFYKNYIENKINKCYILDIQQLQTLRYNKPYNFTIQFLTLIFNRDKKQYQSVKQLIFQYSEEKSKQNDNLKKFLIDKNYHQLAWIITNNKSDKDFVKQIFSILIQNSQYKFLQYVVQHNVYLLNKQIVEKFSNKDIVLFVTNMKKDLNKIKILNFVSEINQKKQYFYLAYKQNPKDNILKFIYHYLFQKN